MIVTKKRNHSTEIESVCVRERERVFGQHATEQEWNHQTEREREREREKERERESFTQHANSPEIHGLKPESTIGYAQLLALPVY